MEVIIGIIILTLLLIIAVPYAIDLHSAARTTKARTLLAAITTAASIVNQQIMVQNLGYNFTIITLGDGSKVTVNYAYPTADMAGIIAATSMTNSNLKFNGNDHELIIDISGEPKDAQSSKCKISYVAPSMAGATPTIRSNFIGC